MRSSNRTKEHTAAGDRRAGRFVMGWLVAVGALLLPATPTAAQEEERAAPPTEFDTYVLAVYTKGPEFTEERTPELADQQERHLGHLSRIWREGWAVAAGPLQDHQNPGERRGIVLFRMEDIDGDLDRAREIMEMDPHVRAGHMGYELYTLWTAAEVMSFMEPPAPEGAGEGAEDDAGSVHDLR